jgi:predicted nucleotide-binding protein (sugar kinase/HSP70/actin superfamily)
MSATFSGVDGKRKLKIADQGIDVDAELKKFEEEERKRLGLDNKTEQWIEDMVGLGFTQSQKSKITLLIGGLTIAHDYLIEGGLKGIGYTVQMLDAPNTAAFQAGKEFGNRGQCNPTYFTVGNLVQYLIMLRDKHGMTAKEIVDKYVFLTAGACGPCRFGMYVTEYRKALRDAGFDGFRVMLFQQTGGVKQATGEASGLDLGPAFFWALLKGMFVGDVINALAYRIRPYELEKGKTDEALEEAKRICYEALAQKTNIMNAMWKCKPLFQNVKVDRTIVKPKVSIIGEFWAMTTEGDGNYQLQRFLEQEGAECDIQLVAAWMLYMLWEARHDTLDRKDLRAPDTAKYGLGEAGPWGVGVRLLSVGAGDLAVRGLFQVFAHTMGLYGYKLPDMDAIAEISHEYYNNDLRGGEGHMEVGKLIMNVVHSKAHMTLSVKPFGCMPSAGVSDGVQSAITEKFPGTIYCPVETSGDGRVNFYSRVQMYLFKAKMAAANEFTRVCNENGVTREQIQAFLAANPTYGDSLHRAPHAHNGTAADYVAEIAPIITKTRWQRAKDRVIGLTKRSTDAAKKSPHMVIHLVESAVKEAPTTMKRVKEDVTLFRELRAAKKATAKAKSIETMDAAAEE